MRQATVLQQERNDEDLGEKYSCVPLAEAEALQLIN